MSEVMEIVGLPHTLISEDETMCEAWFECKDGPLVKLLFSSQAVSVAATKLMDAHLRLTSQSASTNALVQTPGLSVVAATAQPEHGSGRIVLTTLIAPTGTSAIFFLDETAAIQLADQIVKAVQSLQSSGGSPIQ